MNGFCAGDQGRLARWIRRSEAERVDQPNNEQRHEGNGFDSAFERGCMLDELCLRRAQDRETEKGGSEAGNVTARAEGLHGEQREKRPGDVEMNEGVASWSRLPRGGCGSPAVSAQKGPDADGQEGEEDNSMLPCLSKNQKG